MHPLIRVLCFLVFAAWLAWSDPQRLLLGAGLLSVLYLLIGHADLRGAAKMVVRLRWFYLSLLIVYGWFTPGQRVWPDQGSALASFAPTVEGLGGGLLRCAALVLIVLSVNLLLQTTRRDQLMSAIHGLALPLAVVGLSRERLALRMVLVMDALTSVRELVGERVAARREEFPGLRAAGDFASDLVIRVIDRAGRQDQGPVTLALAGPPAVWQWAFPVLLWIVFYAAGAVV